MGVSLISRQGQKRPTQAGRKHWVILVAVLLAVGMLGQPLMQGRAAAILTITPITWNVLGLDITDPAVGPNRYPVGARVCNEGDQPAANVTVVFHWDVPGSHPNINLTSTPTQTLTTLPAASCTDIYYEVTLTRGAAAYGAARDYWITASAPGVSETSTPRPREIYVQPLTAASSLQTQTMSGPQEVVVGETYQYTIRSSTWITGYQQLENFASFPPNIFSLKAITTTYTTPSTVVNTTVYADACGWNNDPSSSTYRTCGTPTDYPGGIVSGTLVTTYTVEIINTGQVTLTNTLYGYTNGLYHYNSDFAADTLPITASAPSQVDIELYLVMLPNNDPTPTLTPPVTLTPTATQPTPTATGSITPNPTVVKTVSPVQAGIGASFSFSIRLTNYGTAPAQNVTLTDNLSSYTYLDVTQVTTSQGTYALTGRNVTVTIGTLMPNETVTVTITVRVNNTAVGTPNPCNIATITFNGGTRTSNQQCFRVVGGSTLPGTGELAPDFQMTNSAGSLLAFGLAGLGLLLVVLGYIALIRLGRKASWVFAAGGLLLMAGVLMGISSLGRAPLGQGEQPEIAIAVTQESHEPTATLPASPTLNPLAVMPAYMFATPVPHEVLPDYPIPSPTIPSDLARLPSQTSSEPDTSPIVRIEIPQLNVNHKVAYIPFDGHTWPIRGLREEVAWLGDTSWPGLGGNTALAAHITIRGVGNGPFRYLSDLQSGDQVTVYTERNVYTYSVREQQIVEETDLSVVGPTDLPQITLITCVDWDNDLQLYLRRLAIFADLISVQAIPYASTN